MCSISDAFEQHQECDLLVTEDGGRHFNLDLWYNGVIPRWHVVGDSIIELDDVGLAELWNGYQKEHPSKPSELEKMRVENEKLKLSFMELTKAREAGKN
jgi:hypothetical protein